MLSYVVDGKIDACLQSWRSEISCIQAGLIRVGRMNHSVNSPLTRLGMFVSLTRIPYSKASSSTTIIPFMHLQYIHTGTRTNIETEIHTHNTT